MTYTELADAINKDFAACYAYTEGAKVVVTYRGKKTDKIFIQNGIVSNIGNTSSIAASIRDKYSLKSK